MTALGKDIGGVTDVGPMLNFVDGPTAAAESVIVSLFHQPGLLWWAPDRGYDIRQHLHAPTNRDDLDDLERNVQSQAEADERVVSCQCTATYDAASKTITLDGLLALETNPDNVQFTVTVSEAGEIINASIG